MKVFLSYKFADAPSKALAVRLSGFLRQLGHSPTAGDNIEASKAVEPEVIRRINECDVLIAIEPQDAGVDRDWISYEQGIAAGSKLPVVFVAFGKPRAFREGRAFIDGESDGLEFATRLVEVFKSIVTPVVATEPPLDPMTLPPIVLMQLIEVPPVPMIGIFLCTAASIVNLF